MLVIMHNNEALPVLYDYDEVAQLEDEIDTLRAALSTLDKMLDDEPFNFGRADEVITKALKGEWK